jgi:hypothetical protein
LDGLKIEITSTSMHVSVHFLNRYFYHTLTKNILYFCVCGEMNLVHPIIFYFCVCGEMNLAHPIPELDRFRNGT